MMKQLKIKVLSFLLLCFFSVSCTVNPYASTNRSYKKQAKTYARSLRAIPEHDPATQAYPAGDYWVGATNFNMRKPNYVVIHHTAQNSTEQTLKTFTTPATQVSAHYVIGRDGKVYQMLHDYLRAWHGGNSKWGNATDLNSSSIGIELDNNGSEPFTDSQISSLLGVLAKLKKEHNIPVASFIGHSDIAPSRKVDPSPLFPWKTLADNGYGLWYDEGILDTELIIKTPAVAGGAAQAAADTIVFEGIRYRGAVPENFNPTDALRIVGYDVRDLPAAIRAFKIHYVQQDISPVLTEADKVILYNLYLKSL